MGVGAFNGCVGVFLCHNNVPRRIPQQPSKQMWVRGGGFMALPHQRNYTARALNERLVGDKGITGITWVTDKDGGVPWKRGASHSLLSLVVTYLSVRTGARLCVMPACHIYYPPHASPEITSKSKFPTCRNTIGYEAQVRFYQHEGQQTINGHVHDGGQSRE